MLKSAVLLPFLNKTVTPRGRKDTLRRQRLLDILGTVSERRLVVVWAPAGYGKTTLLVDFAKDSTAEVCWLTLNEEDQDPQAFLQYLIASLRARFPDFGFAAERYLCSEQLSEKDWTTAAGILLSEFHQDISKDVAIVLEDLHKLEDGRAISRLINLLIERAPSNMHFVISSRDFPQLPCLPSLLARREATLISREDLRFNPQETVALLSEGLGMVTSIENAMQLTARTEGWITGIILLATTSQDWTTGLYSSERISHQILFDYLVAEVLSRLPEDMQKFLLRTSVLSQIEEMFCASLLMDSKVGSYLEQLDEKGLFIQIRQGTPRVYVYHDLFRTFLEARFKSLDPVGYKELNLRVAELYEQKGDSEQAIEHRFKAGSYEMAAASIERVASDYLRAGRWIRLKEWLERLPNDIRTSRPALVLAEAQCLIRAGETSEALSSLTGLLRNPKAEESFDILSTALALKSSVLRLLGRLQAAREAAEEALTLATGHDGSASLVAEIHRQLGSIFASQGEFGRAKHHLEVALELTQGQPDHALSYLLHDALGTVLGETGDLSSALSHFEVARQGWSKLKNEGALAFTLNNTAMLYYEKGEVELALECADQAVAAAETANYTAARAYALVTRGRALRAQKKFKQAVDSFSNALELARQAQESRIVADALNGLGMSYSSIGNYHKAEVLLEQALAETERTGQRYSSGKFALSLGIVKAKQEKWEDASRYLEQACLFLDAEEAIRELAKAQLWQAYILYIERKGAQALLKLKGVAQLIEKLGYGGFMQEHVVEMPELIRYAAAKRVGGEHFIRLFEWLSYTPEKQGQAAASAGVESLRFPQVRASAFGTAKVAVEGHELSDLDWRSKKAKEFFFYLLCCRGMHRKEKLLADIWPELEPEKGHSTFHSNLHRLRQAVFPAVVVEQDGKYVINPGADIWFDLEEFNRSVDAAGKLPRGTEERASFLERSVNLYAGPLLEEFDSEWVAAIQRQTETKYLKAIVSLGGYYVAQEEYQSGVALLEKALSMDPLEETLWYEMIRLHALQGELPVSLKLYEQYSRLARRELETEPSEQMKALRNLLVRGDLAKLRAS
ncbi:MAG: tetratricopeptide repeat protein [Chloroflexi bacterium]|nr:tetratricopeptide repeat protein [Chloroflexota bacterium]